MSRASSPSSGRRYGTARVCQLWEVPRSTVYARRARASRPAQPAAKRGPKGAGTDAALTEQIRAVLARSPFMGVASQEVVSQAGRRSPQGDLLRTTLPMQVDVRDHRIILHEGLTNVEDDDGGHRERGRVGAAPQAGIGS